MDSSTLAFLQALEYAVKELRKCAEQASASVVKAELAAQRAEVSAGFAQTMFLNAEMVLAEINKIKGDLP